MLSTEDNHFLTQIGPASPMGKMLRSYWLPLLYSEEIPTADSPPQRVRLLGEDLIVFRDSNGHVGLLDQFCPHRRASLFFGRNEEQGLRCLYHGWKFNVQGQCVDLPNEPESSQFCQKIKIKSYPCYEANGIVWTYMGPGEPPHAPAMAWAKVPANQKSTLKYLRECNWVQAMEGDFDSSHLGFLHLNFDAFLPTTQQEQLSRRDAYRQLTHLDKKPVLDVQEHPLGVFYGAKRQSETGEDYWRVTQFQLPFYTSVPSYAGLHRLKIWVPIDDYNTLVWEANWTENRALSINEQTGWKNRVPASGFETNSQHPYGKWRFAANRDNDYLIDRERQKHVNFSGMENATPIQDAAMQESMGRIVDRSQEHLSASDAAIIQMRKSLLNAAKTLQNQQELPPGVVEPELYFGHGDQFVLPENQNWIDTYQQRMTEFYRML